MWPQSYTTGLTCTSVTNCSNNNDNNKKQRLSVVSPLYCCENTADSYSNTNAISWPSSTLHHSMQLSSVVCEAWLPKPIRENKSTSWCMRDKAGPALHKPLSGSQCRGRERAWIHGFNEKMGGVRREPVGRIKGKGCLHGLAGSFNHFKLKHFTCVLFASLEKLNTLESSCLVKCLPLSTRVHT